jgi:hypothetical protein
VLKKKTYQVSELIEKFGGRDTVMMDLSDFEHVLDRQTWFFEDDVFDMKDMRDHIIRIKNVNMRYPIFVLESGTIIDGWHRYMYCVMFDIRKIKTIQITFEDIKRLEEI